MYSITMKQKHHWIFGIIVVLGIILITGCVEEGVTMGEVIDKWNEIVGIHNEVGNSLTGFGAALTGEPPSAGEGTDFNSLKIGMRTFASYYRNQVDLSKTYLEQADSKLDEESDSINEFFGLVARLSDPEAKKYGESAANNLREYNSKAKTCISGTSTVIESMATEIGNMANSFETKLEIYQPKVDAGTFTEDEYANLLNEYNDMGNKFATKMTDLIKQLPSECKERDAFFEKAEDAINQLGAIQ